MTATDATPTLPGRLGDPTLDLRTDPRAKPALVAVLAAFGLDGPAAEGLAYKRALERAGVAVSGRMNLGLTHGAELIFRQALPAERRAAVADIRAFADGLTVEHI